MSRQTIVAKIYDKKGRLLGVGNNSYTKTHPLQAYYARLAGHPRKVFLHAEIAALIKCKGQGYRIHISRTGAKGEPRLAAPCPVCVFALRAMSIKEVSYTL